MQACYSLGNLKHEKLLINISILTASGLSLASLGATVMRALSICSACEVGLEQTRCTEDCALGPPSVVGSALRASSIFVVSSREYIDDRCSVVYRS